MKTPVRLAIVMLALLTAGCPHRPGLNKAIRDNFFTPITPPQTQLEPGAVAEISPRYPEAPTFWASPSAAGISNPIHDSTSPDVSNKHEDKTDLSVGASVPAVIRAKLAEKGVRSYSVVATGNVVRRVFIGDYAINVLPKLQEKYGGAWAGPLAQGKLSFLHELWCTDGLEYRFYDSGGVELSASAQLSSIPVDASTGFSWSNENTLTYKGGKGPMCVGYKARPLRQQGAGEVGLQAAGEPTPFAPEPVWRKGP